MSLDAILMMAVTMVLIWGGFIAALVIAMRQERRARKEGAVDSDGDS
jgi:Na+/H+-dicarboxylate symporter